MRSSTRCRTGGFTLIEILVVITIIAALAGLVVALVPQLIGKSEEAQSMNNLKQIGGLLLARQAAGDLDKWSGAAFLLQVTKEVRDEDLKVFISPADDRVPERPKAGSTEFIEMYRGLDLKAGIDDRHSSYAGPDWKNHPMAKAGREALKSRLWGCDRSPKGVPFHNGLVVLYSTGKVEMLKFEDIEGTDESVGLIQVGPNSPDERLKKMCYFPPN